MCNVCFLFLPFFFLLRYGKIQRRGKKNVHQESAFITHSHSDFMFLLPLVTSQKTNAFSLQDLWENLRRQFSVVYKIYAQDSSRQYKREKLGIKWQFNMYNTPMSFFFLHFSTEFQYLYILQHFRLWIAHTQVRFRLLFAFFGFRCRFRVFWFEMNDSLNNIQYLLTLAWLSEHTFLSVSAFRIV